ncbi:MAG TPA: sugar ABC transporter ATP-binding protein [Vicinamibacterales bacterium]|nr:sugar ABC transporter ATP-binding protein [Vicinamibacterales bacterium]
MSAPAPAAEPLLRLRDIQKQYAAPVLVGVDIELREGEVHALMGANGAGKSTLSRIVCGITAPDGGTMTLAGGRYAPRSRREAQRAGVQLVMQELNLIPTLSVAENLFLADLPHRFGFIAAGALTASAARALEAVGLGDLDPRTPTSRLGIGTQQLVAVAAALAHPCRILVLDEPTAALTDAEIERVFTHLRALKAGGTAILYISHRVEEVRRISDRITVLRDGRPVATIPAAGATLEQIVPLMVGERAVHELEARTHERGDVALRVDRLTRGTRVRDVSFEVRRGEIVGLAGLVGSGRTETLRAIFGADPVDGGRVSRGSGPPLRIREPRDAVRAGIGMVPEDRREHAILHAQPIRVNVTLAALRDFLHGRWWIDTPREISAAGELRTRLDVRSHSVEQAAGELSGGNQQKVVIARWLLRDCDILLFDEPTRGIDVAAKAAVYRVLNELAARGKALIVVSSELPELMALCDRIAVMSDGHLVATFDRGAWSEEQIVAAAFSAYAGQRRAPRGAA